MIHGFVSESRHGGAALLWHPTVRAICRRSCRSLASVLVFILLRSVHVESFAMGYIWAETLEFRETKGNAELKLQT